MLLQIPDVFTPDELARCRSLVESAEWADGNITAGTQSAKAKNNRQLPEDGEAARAARTLVLDALSRSALFFTAALPRKIYPPLFNRYGGEANAFGNHIDNAVRTHAASGTHVRTDLSATLFLAGPDEYDGGELVIEDTFGTQSVKLPAGHMILYPSSSVHRVEPVTRGVRIASFFWIQSMVREDERRRMLFDLDMAILALREKHGDTAESVRLTGCYHNLMRMWADT
ncbi:MAG TPA: Fe2+-dependent dioxygenase [Rhodocyclaceae bacterium]|nr:Fe2+-dependent dioxygenase [Rhodocyclaceae bacterium]HMV54638.1 Fe2+-dependent dioxygenase [Rhodocyclaceae bacterium]HMZ83476.1 Fe2+-dependent dioxygenase [Rhodocyclaceae bacterium]HNA03344.1 Fe2+-dependent dioxygenase [Rhodocyclaceae bacterium]HNB77055.1 Fe2+-dependent dioxygenase [Rhodocyclaceae bacterium]